MSFRPSYDGDEADMEPCSRCGTPAMPIDPRETPHLCEKCEHVLVTSDVYTNTGIRAFRAYRRATLNQPWQYVGAFHTEDYALAAATKAAEQPR